jgi:hypothetical protein
MKGTKDMPSPLDELLMALSPVGVAPRSGKCMECGNVLVKDVDIDHSFCNTCWDNMLAHEYTPITDSFGDEICNLCGEDSTYHTRFKVD